MRVMVFAKATEDSEESVPPTPEAFEDMKLLAALRRRAALPSPRILVSVNMGRVFPAKIRGWVRLFSQAMSGLPMDRSDRGFRWRESHGRFRV